MDVSLNQTDDTCRCCLKNGHLISLFDETIFEELEIFKAVTQIVPININRNDGYSQNICIDCKKQVEEFYNFRQMCISSDEFLKSNRRPISRNNEHDYSTLIDEYDMDLSEYLIEPSTLKDDTIAEELPQKTEVVEQAREPSPVLDETQLNFNGPSAKKVKRKSYACPICNKLWITPSKLKRHLSSHKIDKSAPQQHQCTICLAALDSPTKLSQHMSNHIRTNNPGDVNAANAQSENKFLCMVCGSEFLSIPKLQNHMKTQHLRNISIISTGNAPNDVPEKMMTNLELRNSEHVYYSQKCAECGKTFSASSKLRRHLKIHNRNGEKPLPRPARPRRYGELFKNFIEIFKGVQIRHNLFFAHLD